MEQGTVYAYRSTETSITYYVEPLEGDTYEKGCLVSWQPDGEDNPIGAFAFEPKLINLMAELVYDLRHEQGVIAFVEGLTLTATMLRGRADEIIVEQPTEA